MLVIAVAATVIVIKAIHVAVIMSLVSTICAYLFLVLVSSRTCIIIMIIISTFLTFYKVMTLYIQCIRSVSDLILQFSSDILQSVIMWHRGRLPLGNCICDGEF